MFSKFTLFAFLGLLMIVPATRAGIPTSDIINVKVERNIDISTQVVKISQRIEVKNKRPEPLVEYIVHFGDEAHDKHLSYIEAFLIPNVTSKTILPVKITSVKDGEAGIAYSLRIDSLYQPSHGSTVEIEVDAVFTHLLEPYPREITQNDRQLVVYKSRIYFPTKYLTERQNTRVTVPSANGVESYTKLKPTSQTDRIITYGPYTSIPGTIYKPVSVEEVLRVHTESIASFLTTTNLERSIQVSHWTGGIKIDEVIDVKHVGAKLKGSFSRYEYQRDANIPNPSIKSWNTLLPALATDIYYRDEIGNISTSNVRQKSKAQIMEIRPRFPLFGGWKTQYNLGYVLPATKNLFSLDGSFLGVKKYKLRIPFIDHIYDSMVVDQALVKVILPEGASNFEIKVPYDVQRGVDETFYSYLDTYGRPVIVLSKKNLVSWHIQNIDVVYSYKPIYLLHEPLLVTATIFTLCLIVIGLVRTKAQTFDK